MNAQNGKDILLKIEEPVASGSFVTMAGLRARSISLNANSVDITNTDSPDAWRELLPGAGVKAVSISGSGVFKDSVADESVRSTFFSQETRNWQVVIPGFGILSGLFQVAALEYAGDYDREAIYSLTLSSAGAISFAVI